MIFHNIVRITFAQGPLYNIVSVHQLSFKSYTPHWPILTVQKSLHQVFFTKCFVVNTIVDTYTKNIFGNILCIPWLIF